MSSSPAVLEPVEVTTLQAWLSDSGDRTPRAWYALFRAIVRSVHMFHRAGIAPVELSPEGVRVRIEAEGLIPELARAGHRRSREEHGARDDLAALGRLAYRTVTGGRATPEPSGMDRLGHELGHPGLAGVVRRLIDPSSPRPLESCGALLEALDRLDTATLPARAPWRTPA